MGCKGGHDVKHGMSRTRIYGIWVSMMCRCGHRAWSNPDYWKYYISRGITVCPEWHSFTAFAAWAMSHGYDDTLTIDRLDSYGNYSPDNCQWVTLAANLRKRTGVSMSMEKAREIRRRKCAGERAVDLAKEFGINAPAVYKICDGTRWKEGVA